MDEADRLLRHLEEVTEEIQALKHRLSFLESHRAEVREKIKSTMTHPTRQLMLEAFGRKPTTKHRSGEVLALQQTADAVARMDGDVDAHQLADELSISFDAARLRLARAARLGLLVRVKLGKYRTPSHGLVNGAIEPETQDS
jgi:hypothetical protein